MNPQNDHDFTVLHLFSGSGGGALGFQRAGFRSLGSIDLDKIACRDLERLTGERAIVADIAAMQPADLAAQVAACPDVVFTSPPCLPADGIVLTETGPRRIDSVRPGDRVLTHKGRYCNVAKVNVRAFNGFLHGLSIAGSTETQWYTSEHPIWQGGTIYKSAAEFRPGDFVAFPITADCPIPARMPRATERDHVLLSVESVGMCPYTGDVWNLEVDEDDTYCSPFVSHHNCKGFSGCLPEGTSKTAKYQAYNTLALHGIWLCLEAWKTRPKFIVLENVPRIKSRGREWLTHLGALLHHYGYAVDMSTHLCGELGGLAQPRERFLLVARQRETCPDFLRKPPTQRIRTVGEVLFHFPSPAAAHGDKLHKLPRLSAMNQLRLAAIRAGKDWRDLPSFIRLMWGTSRLTDPRVGVDPKSAAPGSWAAKGRPDAYGVQDPNAPGTTIRARQEVQTSRRSVADPRLADPRLTPRAARQNGGFGVNDHEASGHTVVGASSVRSAWASVSDPRLTCTPRSGAYGMLDADEVGPTIIGYHKHDRAPASVADPRLGYRRGGDEAAGKHSGRGCYGVLDPNEPSATIRGRHTVRQAPAALCDWRGWPIATHELHRDEDGGLTLHGPELDLESTRPRSDIVIRAPDGTWHRPMTTRELACLQGFPDDFVFEGSDSSSKTQPGVREHIGNAVPPPAAEALGHELMAALIASHDGGYRLSNGNIWVRPEMEWAA